MSPELAMYAASALSGLFGGNDQPGLTREGQWSFNRYKDLFRQLMEYSNGVPGSTPQEQAALAQTKALAGGDIGNQRDAYLAALGSNNPNAGAGLAQFNSNAAGTMAGIDANALLEFLKNRQNAKFTMAPGLLSNAASIASGPRQAPGQDIGGLLAGLGAQWAAGQTKKPQPFNFNFGGVNYQPTSPYNTSGGFGGGGGGAEPGGGGSNWTGIPGYRPDEMT